METPDITPMQKLVPAVLTLLGALLAVATAFGVDLTTEQIGAVMGAAGGLGGVFIVADAIIRNGRSKIAVNRETIEYSLAVEQAEALGQLLDLAAAPDDYPADKPASDEPTYAFEAPDEQQA